MGTACDGPIQRLAALRPPRRLAFGGQSCYEDDVLGRLWPLLCLYACSAEVAQTGSAIIGGQRDSGDPAVVLLVSYPADESTHFTCTASLIAPTVLLTAAHCVDDANHPGYRFGVFPGDDASGYTTTSALVSALLPVRAVHPHPAYDPAPPFHADIAVVELKAALAVTPLPFAREPPQAGQPARIIGYGQVTYSVFNAAKHQASTIVQNLDGEDTVVVGDAQHWACVGDSGGPALVKQDGVETIIGVDSYTDTTGCVEPAHYRRTDLYTAFLDPFLPPPAPDLFVAPDRAALPDLGGAADQGAPPAPEPSSGGGCQVSPDRPPTLPSLLWVMTLLLFMALKHATNGA
jgi:secreted trypsin-like serine protease